MKRFLLFIILLLTAVHEVSAESQTMQKHDKTLVILIHGFCKGADDMQFWKKALAPEFPNVITPDLPTTYSSFEQCLQKLTAVINAAEPEKYEQIFIAGHSMGGLLAREYLQRNKPANVKKLLCVGTPHYGSKLADIALYIPGAGLIFKPLHALKLSARRNLTTPEISGLEIAVIVSTNNGHWPGKLFLNKEADGLVELTSAHAPDAKHITRTQANHVKMQYDPETAALIKQFLLHGKF